MTPQNTPLAISEDANNAALFISAYLIGKTLNIDQLQNVYSVEVQRAINSVTAKLREENDELKQAVKKLCGFPNSGEDVDVNSAGFNEDCRLSYSDWMRTRQAVLDERDKLKLRVEELEKQNASLNHQVTLDAGNISRIQQHGYENEVTIESLQKQIVMLRVAHVEIDDRATKYLSVGGLFNPELMDHKKVKEMVLFIAEQSRRVISESTNFSHLYVRREVLEECVEMLVVANASFVGSPNNQKRIEEAITLARKELGS